MIAYQTITTVMFLTIMISPPLSLMINDPESPNNFENTDVLEPYQKSFIIENLGQIPDPDIAFYTTGSLRMAFKRSCIQVILDNVSENGDQRTTSFNMKTEGGREIYPVATDQQGGHYNFIKEKGNFKGARLYRSVVYNEVYPGIDLKFIIHEGKLKYEFDVARGSDPDLITLKFEGIDDLEIINEDLYLATPIGTIIDEAPVSFQEGRTKKTEYVIKDEKRIGFSIENYDSSEDMLIDPSLQAGVILGNSPSTIFGTGPVNNSNGDILIGGITNSPRFPTTIGCVNTTLNGGYDIFISSLSSDLDELLFSTFIGGNDTDLIQDIAIDNMDNIYFTGSTFSIDYPTTTDAFMEKEDLSSMTHDPSGRMFLSYGIVTCLDPNCSSIRYSSFLGGNASDNPTEIELDENGEVYISGTTQSLDFPIKNGYQLNHSDEKDDEFDPTNQSTYRSLDGFICKLDRNLTYLYFSTYLGVGSTSDQNGDEYITDMIIDEHSQPVISGKAGGRGFPTTSGTYREEWGSATSLGFILKLSKSGNELNWSTFLDPGVLPTCIYFGNSDEDIYVGGNATGGKLQTTWDAYKTNEIGLIDGFILLLSGKGAQVKHATYLGGQFNDLVFDLEKDRDGNLWIVGDTDSLDFPNLFPSKDFRFDLGSSCFMSRFDPNLTKLCNSILYSGSSTDHAEGILILGNGSICISGYTSSWDLPVTLDPYEVTGGKYGSKKYISVIDPFTNIPSIPLNLTIIEGNEFLNLSWSKPARDGNRTIEGYKIYRKDFGEYSLRKVVQNDMYFYNDTGLENGIRFFYRIKAFNSVGEGDLTSPVHGTPRSTPSIPTELLPFYGDSSINLTWKPPLDDGGMDIIGYKVFIGTQRGVLNFYKQIAGRNFCIVEDLENGVSYFLGVSAVSEFGESQISNTVICTPYSVPSPPLNFHGDVGDGTVHLYWSEPEKDGGHQKIKYRIHMKEDEHEYDIISGNITETTLMVDGLTNGIEYNFKIEALNEEGIGGAAGPITYYPGMVPGKPTNLSIESSDGYIEVAWEAPMENGGFKNMSYNIYKGPSPDKMTPYISKYYHNRLKIQNLENGKEVHISVSAVNIIGEGKRTDIEIGIPHSTPNEPINLSFEPHDGGVTLYWEPPVDNGGYDYLEYEIFYGISNDVLYYYNDTNRFEMTVENLENGRRYFFAVRAKFAFSEGPFSKTISGTPIGLPGSPELLYAISKPSSIEIYWREPEDNGGLIDLKYGIFIWSIGPVPEYPSIIGISGTNYTIMNLSNGKEYQIVVAGMRSSEVGRLSRSLKAVPLDVPQAPKGLTVFQRDGKVHLNWMEPIDNGGSSVLMYYIYRTNESGDFNRIGEITSFPLTYIDNGLISSGTYKYYIIAVNSIGESDGSTIVNITISKDEEEKENSPDFFYLLIPVMMLFSLPFILFLYIVKFKRKMNYKIIRIKKSLD